MMRTVQTADVSGLSTSMTSPGKIECQPMPEARSKADLLREVEETVEQERAEFDKPPAAAASEVLSCLDANEVGDARLFAQRFRGRRCYDHAAGEWYRWAGHHWERHGADAIRDDVEVIVAEYGEEAYRQHKEAMREAQAGNKDTIHESRHKKLLARMRELRSRRRIDSVLDLAATAANLGITGNEWDQSPRLVACSNGVLELLREHPFSWFRDGRPEDYLRAAAPTKWEGLNAVAVMFSTFIAAIFYGKPDLAAFVQRLFAYALAGNPVERVLVMLCGKGANGKSVLLEILQRVLGVSLCDPIESELLLRSHMTRASNSPRPDLLKLRGLRIACAQETGEGRRFDAPELKRLTGGDSLSARAPHGLLYVSWTPTHTLFLSTNHEPTADAFDRAMQDRVVVVPFEQRFVIGAENDPANGIWTADPRLKEKLQAEAPGILAWIVAGWHEYASGGLARPDVVSMATRGYWEGQNHVARFIDEVLEPGGGFKAQMKPVQLVFAQWHMDNVGTEAGKDHTKLLVKRLKSEFKTTTPQGKLIINGVRIREKFLPNPDEPLFSR